MSDRPGSPPSGGDGGEPARVRPVDLRDYVDFGVDAARRVRVHRTATLAVDLWCLEPQQATGVLLHDDRDVSYTVIGGRSWFVTDQGEIGLDPMGSLLVPAGVAHGIDNRGADPLIVLATVAPPGEADEEPPVAADGAAVRDDDAHGGLGRLLRSLRGRRPPGG